MCFGNSSERDSTTLNARPISNSKTTSMPQEIYAPPHGPPPNYKNTNATHSHQDEEYAPPPGPPPSHAPQHNWQTAVPDTSLLPPPPSMGYQASPVNNATEAEAKSAEQWLRSRPLVQPLRITDPAALNPSRVTLSPPSAFQGSVRPLSQGRYLIKTSPKSSDACITSYLPLYSVSLHSPVYTKNRHTIYFEVKILPGSRASEISLALGFVAQPYPPFRLPGWERASLGVHGDDGHRYVNDKWGGRDFTRPFKRGETVGIGMVFAKKVTDQPPAYGGLSVASQMDVEVFFTRNGQKEGGWDIHEELDAQEDLPVTGLEGAHDLYAAVGTFDAVEFEVSFTAQDWLYKP